MSVRRSSCSLGLLLLAFCAILTLAKDVVVDVKPSVEMVVATACDDGDLKLAERMVKTINNINSAELLHIQSALEFILYADVDSSISLHKKAKYINSTVIPPLASLHLSGKACGGLGDIFYVGAVLIKQMVDNNATIDSRVSSFTTMITLCSDSGLHAAAEAHLNRALSLEPNDLQLLVRSTLMTPAVYEGRRHVTATRKLLSDRIDSLFNMVHQSPGYSLNKLDEFSLSPTFYYVYQGFNDKELLYKLRSIYNKIVTEMSLSIVPIAYYSQFQPDYLQQKKINIGFVSAHFRRHSICKLFCGIINNINRDSFNVFVFSALQETNEDESTREIIDTPGTQFVRIGMSVFKNRVEVTSRNIDVLVYLDVGMTPSTPTWAAARLAPVQMVTWGHPVTTAIDNIDYFISSELFHEHNNVRYDYLDFHEQLIQLNSLGLFFHRPVLDMPQIYESNNYLLYTRNEQYYQLLRGSDTIASSNIEGLRKIVDLKLHKGTKIVLCPQFLPKLHPKYDKIFKFIIKGMGRNTLLVVLNNQQKKAQWKRTLDVRWRKSIGFYQMDRILWLDSLTPQEYLTLLALGDVMLDPFPFGGGVTVLESLAVCTPVITLPSAQNVPELANGIIKTILPKKYSDYLIAADKDDYVSKVVDIFEENATSILYQVRKEICQSFHLLYDNTTAVQEYETLFKNIYRQATVVL